MCHMNSCCALGTPTRQSPILSWCLVMSSSGTGCSAAARHRQCWGQQWPTTTPHHLSRVPQQPVQPESSEPTRHHKWLLTWLSGDTGVMDSVQRMPSSPPKIMTWWPETRWWSGSHPMQLACCLGFQLTPTYQHHSTDGIWAATGAFLVH